MLHEQPLALNYQNKMMVYLDKQDCYSDIHTAQVSTNRLTDHTAVSAKTDVWLVFTFYISDQHRQHIYTIV